MEPISPYRPHNPGHDYKDKGIYLVTLIVRDREALLGRLNDDALHPAVELSEIGRFIQYQWSQVPSLQANHGNQVRLLAQVVMPDHWHGVIEVCHAMSSWTLGDIIQATKCAITSQYQRQCGVAVSPISANAYGT